MANSLTMVLSPLPLYTQIKEVVSDSAVDDTTDIGLRRTRFVLQGQLTDRVYFYTQYGMNNFNFLSQMNGNRHIAAYFHDAFGE